MAGQVAVWGCIEGPDTEHGIQALGPRHALGAHTGRPQPDAACPGEGKHQAPKANHHHHPGAIQGAPGRTSGAIQPHGAGDGMPGASGERDPWAKVA
jgi:hypothetical protein